MPRNTKSIFISWSGPKSGAIAKILKKVFEGKIFENAHVNCFVSSKDIPAGETWYSTIKKELGKSSAGIAIITDDNKGASWIQFESGVVVGEGKSMIPLLFECEVKALDKNPLNQKEVVCFEDKEAFISMVRRINRVLGEPVVQNTSFDQTIGEAYEQINKEIAGTIQLLKEERDVSKDLIFPKGVKEISRKRVYISFPMSSIDFTDDVRGLSISLYNVLYDLGLEPHCSACKVGINDFEDTSAVVPTYKTIESCGTLMAIIPSMSSFIAPSSIWAEIGYGIALSKQVVVFKKKGDELPYMINDSEINHVKVRTYNTEKDLIRQVQKVGEELV